MRIITDETAVVSTDRDIEEDLSDIAEYLRETHGGTIPTFDPFYKDGTRKPYEEADSHVARVRKAQESWRWDDGEVA